MKKSRSLAKKDTKLSMIERRRYLRFYAPMDVEYKTLTLNPIFGKALAKDLSREGVRVDLKNAVAPGTSLELRMNVPGDNLPVFATGKVAWMGGPEAGIKLTKITPADRKRVMEYIYKEWLKTSKKNKK
jgi:c-di-GMP-binding flagellar brake protein YcgR